MMAPAMPGDVKAKPTGVGYAAGLDIAWFDVAMYQERPAIPLDSLSAIDDQDPATLLGGAPGAGVHGHVKVPTRGQRKSPPR